MGSILSYQFMFLLQNIAEEVINRGNFRETMAKFGLTLSVTQTAVHLHCAVVNNNDHLSKDFVRTLISYYKKLLCSIVQQPNQIIRKMLLLTKEEENQLLVEFNNTGLEYPRDKTLIDLFEEQAEKNPANIALVFKNEELTYGN